MDEVRIGDWTVRPGLNRVSRDGREAIVEPRVAAVLAALGAAAGQVVSKDALAAAVWARRAVTDDAVLKAVSKARAALGDDPKRPRYIETVRGKGYRAAPPATVAAGRPGWTALLAGAAGVMVALAPAPGPGEAANAAKAESVIALPDGDALYVIDTQTGDVRPLGAGRGAP